MDVSAMVPELLTAMPLTLAITFTALIVGFFLALAATTFRVIRMPVISPLTGLYVSYARSVPVVLQLFVAFYGLPLLVALLGVPDFFSIFAQSQLTAALNFYYLEAFVIAVAIYMVIAYVVTQTADRLERTLRVWT